MVVAVRTLSILVFHAQRLGKYPFDCDWDSFLLSLNPVFSYLEVRRQLNNSCGSHFPKCGERGRAVRNILRD
jgi:hypothetical protein